MNNRRFRPRNNSGRRFPSQQSKRDLMNAIYASQREQKKTFHDDSVYIPKHSFGDFPISQRLLHNINQKGYTSPTPIQDEAIGPLLKGRDIIGIANTGTGKTAAFLIPLIEKVLQNKSEKVLILTPTRELALQIQEEFQGFSRGLGIYSSLCIGGASSKRQIFELRRNPQFVIGTPGRIKDLIGQRGIYLQDYHSVVLDEADRMVDIGFIKDIQYFISLLPHNRQSLFFSATVSRKVKEILDTFIRHDAVTVSVKQQETSENVHQDVIQVKSRDKKIEQLHDLLIQKEFEKVLVFGRTKWGIQKLSDELVKRGFKAGAIHGNKRQSQRQRTLEQFKNNKISILLATDVASRGLDIHGVSHVINYDIPETYDDYVHRIGRTGRANKKGVALTFIE